MKYGYNESDKSKNYANNEGNFPLKLYFPGYKEVGSIGRQEVLGYLPTTNLRQERR